MKLILPALLLLGFRGYAQQKIQEQVYCPELHDTVRYEVQIPEDWEGWDPSVKHASIYTLSYGIMDEDYLTAQVSYFRKLHYTLPNLLVVNVKAGQEEMGYSYETGLLNPRGLGLVACIKNQIIPAVTKRYNTSAFRTYIGHSQAASYAASYLFLHEPTLFNGYILLAPERIGPEQPPFHLNDTLRRFYNGRTTFCYVAVGLEDAPRRRAFARYMQQELSTLDTTRFYFHYDSIARAGHNDILGLSLEFALSNIFQFYDPGVWADSTGSMMDRVRRMEACIRSDYDLTPENTAIVYGTFANAAAQRKDTAGLLSVLEHFYNEKLKGWNVMQFGDYCGWLKLTERQGHYYDIAIQKILASEMDTRLGPPNLSACYTDMAFDVYRQDSVRAWDYLQQNLALCRSGNRYAPKDGLAYYDLGRYSAIRHYKVREGLEALQTYVRLQGGKRDAGTNFFLGRNYFWLGDMTNARRYMEEGLTEEPHNKVVEGWLKQIP